VDAEPVHLGDASAPADIERAVTKLIDSGIKVNCLERRAVIFQQPSAEMLSVMCRHYYAEFVSGDLNVV
jgi:hypothetical protein